ncbi:acetylornithine deacetylase [Parvularcula sp. ZS-1/3]|uniref:Acetylornithine deacetylase n=1 Tax=Parvularcula mediterranea TaxID=2732508 RepID=A0A7Y3W410_9PROT|nr:acetylornithine deacetylase [Parvularcula mediterranea]NNU14782.1 acetylornithine deacetylase [Parvularcula mediterranea]
MAEELEAILGYLAPLIAADTQNPPRAIDGEHPLLASIRQSLPGFDIFVEDLGEGCLIIEAIRGQTDLVFNVHMDTVPVAPGWSHHPHTLTRGDDRAFGLGTCDTKGAAAILFALAARTDAPMHLLLTTDEEAGQSRCIRSYLEREREHRCAIVAEPTDGLARLSNRGLVSARMSFRGQSGHASVAGGRSAVHDAARLISTALEQPWAEENRLNFGRIEGGQKPNMIAAEAVLLFGFRSLPGTDHSELLESLAGIVPDADLAPRFVGPALPSDADGHSAKAQEHALQLAEEWGLATGEPVDFWTEASLFSEAGTPAIVLGAGSIKQAHAPDEFVTYEQLLTVSSLYERIISHG